MSASLAVRGHGTEALSDSGSSRGIGALTDRRRANGQSAGVLAHALGRFGVRRLSPRLWEDCSAGRVRRSALYLRAHGSWRFRTPDDVAA